MKLFQYISTFFFLFIITGCSFNMVSQDGHINDNDINDNSGSNQVIEEEKVDPYNKPPVSGSKLEKEFIEITNGGVKEDCNNLKNKYYFSACMNLFISKENTAKNKNDKMVDDTQGEPIIDIEVEDQIIEPIEEPIEDNEPDEPTEEPEEVLE